MLCRFATVSLALWIDRMLLCNKLRITLLSCNWTWAHSDTQQIECRFFFSLSFAFFKSSCDLFWSEEGTILIETVNSMFYKNYIVIFFSWLIFFASLYQLTSDLFASFGCFMTVGYDFVPKMCVCEREPYFCMGFFTLETLTAQFLWSNALHFIPVDSIYFQLFD